jgi:hypothetical protein
MPKKIVPKKTIDTIGHTGAFVSPHVDIDAVEPPGLPGQKSCTVPTPGRMLSPRKGDSRPGGKAEALAPQTLVGFHPNGAEPLTRNTSISGQAPIRRRAEARRQSRSFGPTNTYGFSLRWCRIYDPEH